MATTIDTLSSLMPHIAASELFDYPQFVSVQPPAGREAIAAYRGYIRPFADDQTARHILRAIDCHAPLQIAGGRLHVDASHLSTHPFEKFLTGMAIPCTVLILEFEGVEHPRAFLIDPLIVPRFSQSPHLRLDKSIVIDGQFLPALCVYSGNLFHYSPERSKWEQFLDQVATYLAKHLIWLKTRMLFKDVPRDNRELIYRRKPGEIVTNLDLIKSPDMHWDGYWPGPSAPSGTEAHLTTINRKDECWCWSGKTYEECCRPKESSRFKKMRVRQYQAFNR